MALLLGLLALLWYFGALMLIAILATPFLVWGFLKGSAAYVKASA
jgi:uncharacterized Tic20 family protein